MAALTHPKCGKTFPNNNRDGHCAASGRINFPLWPTTITGTNLDAAALEEAPDGRSVSPDALSDYLGAVAELVEPFGFIPVDASEFTAGVSPTSVLAMMGSMFLRGQNAEVARIVIGSVAVDVVDVLAAFRLGDKAVLVCLQVLGGSNPSEPNVSFGGKVAPGRRARWFLVDTEHPARTSLAVGGDSIFSAGIAPPALLSGSGNYGLTVDADNVHALSIQWFCCETFIGLTSFEAHRVGEHGKDRRCEIQPYETIRENGSPSYGHWTDERGYQHYGKQLTPEESAALIKLRKGETS